jgi:hypothetical protein
VLGFLCAGAAVASLIVNSRVHSQIIELRRHMSLLRNLQVGVIKTKPGYEIVECNDRAEELCERRLPKPGVKLDPAPNYFDVFDHLVQDNGAGYEAISKNDIDRARESGKASAYFARVRTAGAPKWMFVRATPIMEPEQMRVPRAKGNRFRRRKIWQITRHGSFATITDACKERAETLSNLFR